MYLDANTTVQMCPETIESLKAWCNRGSIDLNYNSAIESRSMLQSFKMKIAEKLSFSLEDYDIIFTSGASESNVFMATSLVRGYISKTKKLPHVIISSAEHKSLINCCTKLRNDKLCTLTVIRADEKTGIISEDSLNIRPNTCLVSVMSTTMYVGIINDIKTLASRTHSYYNGRIPFHTDASQSLGKISINVNHINVDAVSLSMHKIGGPTGIGLLIIKRNLINGYGLCDVYSQDSIMNVMSIGASYTAFTSIMKKRKEKNNFITSLKKSIKTAISKKIASFDISDYPYESKRSGVFEKMLTGSPVIFWIKSQSETLPNTILLALCNVNKNAHQLSQLLLRDKIIVYPIQSNDLIDGIYIPPLIRNMLRISITDYNDDIAEAFADALYRAISH